MNSLPNFCDIALEVIHIEANAIQKLSSRLDHQFTTACELMLACKGRIVVIGIGKSGHIANKIAATLSSTGTPAFFLHASEASHGDMGALTPGDVVIALSNSGATPEILSLLATIKRLSVPLITLTGNPNSPLATAATVNLNVSVDREACPLGLAPTASTTAALVMGDALAMALLTAQGFTLEDFAKSHPGGHLGKRLLLRVDEIMATKHDIPKVYLKTPLREALIEISQKKLGFATVVNEEQTILGIFTDGDLRRALNHLTDIHTTLIEDVMTNDCKSIPPHTLAAAALKQMEDQKINALMISDEHNRLLGVINMHHLLAAGIL